MDIQAAIKPTQGGRVAMIVSSTVMQLFPGGTWLGQQLFMPTRKWSNDQNGFGISFYAPTVLITEVQFL